ncbi:MAG: HAD-IIB family hydrolase [Holosporales bacterium]|jgi:phosphomannomutase|nr:HAD-IIB family hydrolase [Holosporales bacterium]
MDKKPEVIFLSDMDGTLTPSRLPMEEHFARELEKLLDHYKFYIVTGSDLAKVAEQIPPNIISKVSGVYASMGNEFYVSGKKLYENEFTPEGALLEKLTFYRNNTKYPYELYPNFIEERCGMVNFCVVGRDCPLAARRQYQEWDDASKEREGIALELSAEFPKYDFSIGGSISIDIVPHGFGKVQAADRIRKIHPNEKIIFLGDRTEKGGNDYDLAQRLLELGNSEIVAVRDSTDALEYLRSNGFLHD